jgi:hypothetical protein
MFPTDVKQRAMVECGRRCCLCHKFCGVRLECHHLVQPRDGGQDTFDNCIPLCFDCHAEVGHYTSDHPKGTKFTPQELRQHRDRWFAKVRAGIPESAPENFKDLDRKLFLHLLSLLGSSREMTHFHKHDYGTIFPAAIDERVREFLKEIELPETEFFDLEMEGALSDLRAAADTYNESCLSIVCRHDRQMDYCGVPREWREGSAASAEKFQDAVKLLNQHASSMWNAYCQFIKIGRQRLNVELHDE